jgi:hypothetical protein
MCTHVYVLAPYESHVLLQQVAHILNSAMCCDKTELKTLSLVLNRIAVVSRYHYEPTVSALFYVSYSALLLPLLPLLLESLKYVSLLACAAAASAMMRCTIASTLLCCISNDNSAAVALKSVAVSKCKACINGAAQAPAVHCH